MTSPWPCWRAATGRSRAGSHTSGGREAGTPTAATHVVPVDINRLWTLLAVVALLASGCASESGNEGDRTTSDGFRAHRSGSGSGMDAIVAGIVETDDEAGCIWLSDPDGARYPVVWPVGTLAQSDPTLIILRGGQVVEPGDRVEGGGGYVPAGQAMNGMGLEPFPSECVHAGDAAVFNSDSPIAVTEGVGLEVAETLWLGSRPRTDRARADRSRRRGAQCRRRRLRERHRAPLSTGPVPTGLGCRLGESVATSTSHRSAREQTVPGDARRGPRRRRAERRRSRRGGPLGTCSIDPPAVAGTPPRVLVTRLRLDRCRAGPFGDARLPRRWIDRNARRPHPGLKPRPHRRLRRASVHHEAGRSGIDRKTGRSGKQPDRLEIKASTRQRSPIGSARSICRRRVALSARRQMGLEDVRIGVDLRRRTSLHLRILVQTTPTTGHGRGTATAGTTDRRAPAARVAGSRQDSTCP